MYLTTAAVYQRLTKQLKLAGSQKALALKLEVSPQYLSDILSRKREISHEFARKLGLEKRVRFWWSPSTDK